MRRLAATVIAILGSACASAEQAAPDATRGDARRPDASEGDAPPGTPDASDVDAAPGTPDAGPVDAMVDAMLPASGHLLLSEVVLAPTGGELIEIVNPTGAAVSLANYYVTDVPTYFQLPAGTQTIDSADFIARFPAGASIAAGATITVALDTVASYMAAYAVAPTYSIGSDTMIVTATGTPTLTNAGEPVVLFFWDGATDLVRDVDLVVAGTPTAGNLLAAKSGVAIDGPDGGAGTSTYATDAATVPATAAPGAGFSIKRILGEAGHETQTGAGNGITGDDETSEATGTTWDSTFTAPTPGVTAI